jgi:hypothetical protein
MRPAILMAMLGIVVAGSNSLAQTAPSPSTAPAPTSQSSAQQPNKSDGLPPCPTFAQQDAALGKKNATGSEISAGQPGERSGILPSAGGPGIVSSAAPTMGQGGSVRSPLDCPLVADHPNALPPGPKVMPESSK